MQEFFNLYKNGFVFRFTVTSDKNGQILLRENFGTIRNFRVEVENLEALHDQLLSPHLLTVDDRMKKVDEVLKSIREAYAKFLNFGLEWKYWKLGCQVSLDIVKYEEILLAEDQVVGLTSEEEIQLAARQMMDLLFPKAFESLVNLQNKMDLSDLVISYSPEKLELQNLYDFLRRCEATILNLGVTEDMTGDNIRKWVRGTIDFKDEEEDPEFREMFDDTETLNRIYASADDLALFIASEMKLS